MTAEEFAKRIDELRYELDDMDIIIRSLRKEWYEKGSYIPLLRLHAVSVRIGDLIEALDNLGEVEKDIIGGIKL